jgi:hypothetical protein
MELIAGIHSGIEKAKGGLVLTGAPGDSAYAQFLAHCPASVREYFDAHPELWTQVERLVESSVGVQEAPGPVAGGEVVGSALGCWGCKTGAWAGIVIVLAGVIVVSQGAMVAPLIAMDAGLIPVFAAIFGISDMAMTTIVAGAGLTLGGLVEAGCKTAGCC